MTMDITIRDIDDVAYRKAKVRAAEENKKMGEFITEAIELKLSQPKKKGGKAFLEVLENPIDWGFKTNLAKEVDEYVYR